MESNFRDTFFLFLEMCYEAFCGFKRTYSFTLAFFFHHRAKLFFFHKYHSKWHIEITRTVCLFLLRSLFFADKFIELNWTENGVQLTGLQLTIIHFHRFTWAAATEFREKPIHRAKSKIERIAIIHLISVVFPLELVCSIWNEKSKAVEWRTKN